ncbi:MAG: enoyl-CoA hydratase-related protein [Myxococcota bacterium]
MFELLARHIGQITLHRPKALNAFNHALLDALAQDLETAKQQDLRVLIVTGSGEKAFSAGADLKERASMSVDETRAFLKKINLVFDAVANFDVPTIAFINGVAFGGGLELALACDIRVMAPHAQVGLTECSWGIMPGAGGCIRMPQIVGPAKAAELIFSAAKISAEECLKIDLVNQIDASPLRLADQIAACSSLSLKQAKLALKTRSESEHYEALLSSPDRLEGLNAFIDKRKPIF